MSRALKISLLVGGTTATIGAGVFASRELFSAKVEKESTSALLSKNLARRVIATTGEDLYWANSWSEYRKSKKDVWNLGDSEVIPDSFKTTCKNKLVLKVEGRGSKEYQDFLHYCTRDTLVIDLIKENNPDRELIPEGDGTSEDWKDVWDSYIQDRRNKAEIKQK